MSDESLRDLVLAVALATGWPPGELKAMTVSELEWWYLGLPKPSDGH